MMNFKSTILTCCLGVMVAGSAAGQTVPLFENYGTRSDEPQIDAVSFFNAGRFSANSDLPYDTQNTRNFENTASGLMDGSVGYRFDLVTTQGRFPAETFINRGIITAADNVPTLQLLGGIGSAALGESFNSLAFGSLITVSATNITSSGFMISGSAGLLSLEGQNVDLSRGGFGTFTDFKVVGIATDADYDPLDDNIYINDVGVDDIYWAVGTNNVLGGQGRPISPANFATPNPVSPLHDVFTRFGTTNRVLLPRIGPPDYNGWVLTNALDESNIVVHAVLISSNTFDTNIMTRVRFAPSSVRADWFIPMVEFALPDIDVVTGEPIINCIYITDAAVTMSNLPLATNLVESSFRPANYSFGRTPPFQFEDGAEGNTELFPELLFNDTYESDPITNSFYTAYSADIGITSGQADLFSNPFLLTSVDVPLNEPTNSPGRIEIKADNLDLTRTRMRSEGLITIVTDNLLGNERSKIDSPVLNFRLSSTSGTLSISNLVQNDVLRLAGSLSLYTGIWTNKALIPVEGEEGGDPDPDAGDDGTGDDGGETNEINMTFHVMMVENAMTSVQQTLIENLITSNTNVINSDPLRIRNSILIDAERFVNNNLVTFSGDFSVEQFPNLEVLENNGDLNFTASGLFGSDRPDPIDKISNSGTILGSTHFFNVGEFSNRGLIQSSIGRIDVQATSVDLDSGVLQATADITIKADDIRLENTIINTGAIRLDPFTNIERVYPGALILDAAKSFQDGGFSAGNIITATDGIHLLRLPTTPSDLPGTHFISAAPRFAEVKHSWASRDRGSSSLGFEDNMSIGQFTLAKEFDSLFTFKSVDEEQINAIYIESLNFIDQDDIDFGSGEVSPDIEFLTAEEVADILNIEENMTVYFATSGTSPEELENMVDGLVWVKSYAGPNSSKRITLSDGSTTRVNLSLVESLVSDSDADGQVNGEDDFPFDGVQISGITDEGVNELGQRLVNLTFTAAAKTFYSIERNVMLTTTENQWETIEVFNHDSAENALVTQQIILPDDSPENFLRINYNIGGGLQ